MSLIFGPFFLVAFFLGGDFGQTAPIPELLTFFRSGLVKKNPFEVWLGFGIFDG